MMGARRLCGLLLLWLALWAAGCSESSTPVESLTILACPEAKEVEPAILQAAKARRLNVRMLYKSPVDIMLDLQGPLFPCDAVFTANMPWMTLGDSRQLVREAASIMHSPVALGVRRSLAESLGWIDTPVSVVDVLAAVEAHRLGFAMAAPSQSTSGAAATMGLLLALAGMETPDAPFTPDQLHNARLQAQARQFLEGVTRTAAGSMLLRDLFLSGPSGAFGLDAMLNDEAMLLGVNRLLEERREPPLQLIYPTEGLGVADFTLGFVEKGDNKHKLERFIELRNTLLEPDAQQAFTAAGYRTALLGMTADRAARHLFKPAWGVDVARPMPPIRWPEPAALLEALALCHTQLRKPSATVMLFDMRAPGLEDRVNALRSLVEPERPGWPLLQPGARDVTMILPFGGPADHAGWTLRGNAPEDLAALRRELDTLSDATAGRSAQGQRPVSQAPPAPVDLAPALHAALERLLAEDLTGMLTSVILLVGGPVTPPAPAALQAQWRQARTPAPLPPCYVVATDPTATTQLTPLTELAAGRVFDGSDLGVAAALRLAKAGN